MVRTLTDWRDGRVIWNGEAKTDRDALAAAIATGAYLAYANLRGANLICANLIGAYLSSADLSGSNLRGACLIGANLRGANLSGANLSDANLVPTMVLLANIGAVSNELCADLMAYDAANHPDPSAFGRWAAGGECPYSGVHVGRVANFKQRRECWQEGRAVLSALELMQRVLRETCADSDYHEKAVR